MENEDRRLRTTLCCPMSTRKANRTKYPHNAAGVALETNCMRDYFYIEEDGNTLKTYCANINIFSELFGVEYEKYKDERFRSWPIKEECFVESYTGKTIEEAYRMFLDSIESMEPSDIKMVLKLLVTLNTVDDEEYEEIADDICGLPDVHAYLFPQPPMLRDKKLINMSGDFNK